jgi:hypothetical protein
MRNFLVFILVALFALGGLMLVGCKKKEEPAETVETAETAEVIPETVEEPETAVETAATGEEEPPVEEEEPGEGE